MLEHWTDLSSQGSALVGCDNGATAVTRVREHGGQEQGGGVEMGWQALGAF